MRRDAHITRRHFGIVAGGALASFALGEACHLDTEAQPADAGRLTARPRPDGRTSTEGQRALGLGRARDAILRIPPRAASALPLFVLLHGAGGSGERVLRRLSSACDEAGVAVLAPDSRESSWDAVRDSFGPDVTFIDRALARVFDSVAIDPSRVAVGGFSDGATYAISLGLINGDLFHRVVAFSPGFVVDGTPRGKPEFLISHGTADPILPLERTSRPIVASLRKRGYSVTFREFQGGHEIPADIAHDGMQWISQP